MPPTRAEPLAVEPIFEREGHSRLPTELSWTRGTGRLAFLWSEKGKRDIWVLEPDAAEPHVLLEAGALRSGEQVLDYDGARWSPDGTALLLGKGDAARHHTAATFPELYLYRLSDASLTQLEQGEGQLEDPLFSPDGKKVAFVRDADLAVVDLGSGERRQLTSDGVPGTLLNGIPDWVYWEEIWGRRSVGYWWSSDSRRLAYLQTDSSAVPTYPLIEESGIESRVHHQRYPKAGDSNPRLRLGVVSATGGKTRWMQVEGDDSSYLVRAGWTPGDRHVYALLLSREQDEIAVLLCDPESGECKTKLVERRASWVDVEDDFRFLADDRLIWGSDRDGWRRLYLYDDRGEPMGALTPEGIAVTRLEAVDEDEGLVYYTGYEAGGLGAKDRHLYRLKIADKSVERLAGGTGWNSSVVAPDGFGWVITHSAANRDPRATCVRRIGGPPVPLPVKAPTSYDRNRLPPWEFLLVPGPDGAQLPARMLKPADFDPGRSYPVIMYHYGGPGSQTVQDAAAAHPVRDLWHQRQAQRGYVVFNLDNRASRYFGKLGAEKLHRRFGELELADQQAGVAYLSSLDWVDADRIGLWGWSGGGANTLYSVFRSPGTWAAAVAGAPVTDWRLYDSIWTERYLDHPDDNPDGYRDSSPITWAADLEDALLIVHGTGDDNVHPQNTLDVAHALVEAEIPFEQALYRGEKHGFRQKASAHFYQRMEKFFDRELRRVQRGEQRD
jgi:dipeptidyl-peptidase-4